MDIYLEKLHSADAEELFTFERNNRTFFEEMVPTRGDEYYNFETFQRRHESLLNEQAKGSSRFYLIKDKNSLILGRMNLVDIDEIHGIGHLGYRVGQIHTGKGIANRALNLLVVKVKDEGRIKQIKAKTTSNNIASQRVLLKNDFEHVGTSDEVFSICNRELQFLYYNWTGMSN
ncbi:GNAT family protein [Filibacter tadaridae]|uniref:Ribosomal-protein-S5-alanine N-acetyltransferase n=1 Tax=Filibacter tadaridae TaxID=2483811 RepID=A0A3P5XCT6_9BACL|nr:GNAT family protein [Filibacter tadaridae]VDC32506.1 ribosomal-protein-S5-alanine N-acetyltransferase [Filibacter tadaridae]